jgi:hypothetical protein
MAVITCERVTHPRIAARSMEAGHWRRPWRPSLSTRTAMTGVFRACHRRGNAR